MADGGMTHGYHGTYLVIDVASGAARRVPLPERVLRQFLGGSGLGAHLLLELGQAAADPLAPSSPLAFVFSPLVGSPLTTSAKFAVVGKSPLTHRFNDSLASSRFAIAGKQTGCDAIVLTGRAEVPSVVVVDGDQVRVEPCRELWGTSCPAAQRLLAERLGGRYALAVIGPAGENLVPYATISHDGRHAGRGGHGAVLGSKNIKAIAVRGAARTSFAAPAELMRYARDLSRRSFGPATAKYRELGTAANMLVFNRLKALPTRNFTRGSFDEAARLSPESLSAARAKTQASCAACTIGCEHIYALAGEAKPTVRMEYENLFALGTLCAVGDPDQVLAASHRCDELGIDTISTGGTIAFAMECAERGLVDADWLRFGDGAAVLRAIELIAARQGLGELLAAGSRSMARALGPPAPSFAPHVKGLELPGYEPRALQTMALGLAVGARGGDHNRSGAYEADFSPGVDRKSLSPRSASLAVETEDRAVIMDSLILCKFLRGVLTPYYDEAAQMLRWTTGWDVTAAELVQTAGRIVTARKVFNVRAGWTPAEDTLPDRIFDEPLADDSECRLSRERLAAAIVDYNRLRGWSDEGWPQTK